MCAQEAQVQLGLQRVVLMPAGVPPHKVVKDEPGPEHRLQMCRLAVAGDSQLSVSELEVERDGPSYTVDTLDELHCREPDNDHFLILGADAALELPSWRESERIRELARVAIADRDGVGSDASDLRFTMPRVDISSTLVRERVRAGMPISYLVPDGVARYIAEHDLYMSTPGR